MSKELFNDLADEIRNRRVVAVVGAGVSVAATGGVPIASWIGLLRHGIARIVDLNLAPSEKWQSRQLDILEEACCGSCGLIELLSVAEQVSMLLRAPDGGEWRRWLRETIGSLNANNPAIIEAIADLGIPIVTTNYDGLIEKLTDLPALTWKDGERAIRVFRGEENAILHLHGYWEQPDTCVLGIRAYDDLLRQSLPQHLEKMIPTLHSLLFIGCGATLEDPNFSALRTWMRTNLGGTEHRHYRFALHSELEPLKREHMGERIFLLDYGANYTDLEPFLQKLKLQVDQSSNEPLAHKQPAKPARSINPNPYAERARKKWGAIDLTALARPGAMDEDTRIKLADVFIPQNARRARPSVSLPRDYLESQRLDAEREIRLREEVLQRWEQAEKAPVLDFLGRPDLNHVVILGDPGAGKSTLARFLLLRLLEPMPLDAVEPWRQSLAEHVPFIVELRDYIARESEGKCSSLLDYLGYLGQEQGFGFGEEALHDQLNEGCSLLIFDGLDEIFNPLRRERIVEEIIGLQSRYRLARLVVTSRIAGFKAKTFEEADFTILTLDDLSEAQIEKFAMGWFVVAFSDDPHQAERFGIELLDAVKARPQLKAIAGNPLIFTIMAIVARHEPLERSRTGVYEQALTTLCHNLDFKRKSFNVPADSPLQSLGPSDKLALLRHVAWAMQEMGDSLRANTITQVRLEAAVRSFFQNFGLEPIQARRATNEMIQVLQERNWILTLRGPELYGFVHRTFLEYLCASQILQRFRSQQLTIDDLVSIHVLPRADDDSWQEVIRLLAGQLGRDNPEHAGKIITALVSQSNEFGDPDNRLAIACECLAELDGKQLGHLQSEISILVDALYSWLAQKHEPQLWTKLDQRIASALENIHAPQSVRVSLNLRALPRRVSPTISALSVSRIVAAFWDCGERTRTYLVEQARSSKEWQTSADAITTLAAYFRDSPDTRPLLQECALKNRDGSVRSKALIALAESFHGYSDTLLFLRTRAINDSTDWVRGSALVALAEAFHDDPATLPLLRERAVEDFGEGARAGALRGLAKLFHNDPDTLPFLRARAVEDLGQWVRSTALRALAEAFQDDPATLPFLRARAVEDPGEWTRRSILETLDMSFHNDPDTLPFLRARAVEDLHYWPRSGAIKTMGKAFRNDPATLPFLRARAVEDPHEKVRAGALEALAEAFQDDPATLPFLRARAVEDSSGVARAGALGALGKSFQDDPATLPFLRARAVEDSSGVERAGALKALAEAFQDDPATLPLLRERAAEDPDEWTRAEAAEALAEAFQDDPATLPLLRARAVEDSSGVARAGALGALGKSFQDDPATLPFLRARAVKDPDKWARRSALEALVKSFLDDPATLSFLRERAVEDPDDWPRAEALEAFAEAFQDDPATLPLLRERAVEDPDEWVRQRALKALAEVFCNDPATLPFLRARAVEDPSSEIRKSILGFLPEKG